ncbi:MAG: hypothetical protein IJU04_07105 [Ruminococcus sp.]|nr:hypothetical protein [Ruminococcus sp.]
MESNDFILTDELLEKVNKFSRAKLTADEIYTFPVVLCDNEIDRDFERFSIDSLKTLAELFVGKTGIFDHNPKGENQTARIFDTELKISTDRKTQTGEPYACLVGKAYMVRTEKNEDLIMEIDAGIKKEVSVSCSVKSQICSICGADNKKAPCTHIKGATYGDEVCHFILNEPNDAYEWSFVAIPAQRNAGVTKTFEDTHDDDCKLVTELKKLRQENAQAREMLRREVLRLSFLFNPKITVKTVGLLTCSMSFSQLLELRDSLEKAVKGMGEKSCSNYKNSLNIDEFKIK